MEKTKSMFLTSAKELKTTSTMAVCAMLAALALILNSVASINIGPYVKIGFSGIPNQIADYLFGPITGCLFAGVLDIVKFFIRPDGPFFFGFTFNAMLAALALILNSVASINIGPYVKIGFSGIPNQIADYLFGPITGCLFAGVLDTVKFFIRPDGPFFFGFTFNAMLAAFIYGCFYYKHKLTFRRVLIAKLVVVLIVNVLLNTLWLDMLYGKGFLAILPMRTVKNLIMWPIDSFIFFTITRLIEQTGIFNLFRKPAAN